MRPWGQSQGTLEEAKGPIVEDGGRELQRLFLLYLVIQVLYPTLV